MNRHITSATPSATPSGRQLELQVPPATPAANNTTADAAADQQLTPDAATAEQGRGHTAAASQLELVWEVPPASPATTDFVCWLWAAFPPRNGRLNVSRIATALDVSPRTIRRWIAKDDPKLRRQQAARLHQRAILRGRGEYLWPDLDPVSRRRTALAYKTALRNHQLITHEPDRIAPGWRENGTLEVHEVHVVHFPRAHAYGVSATRHPKAKAKVMRHGEILETVEVPNKYAAVALKHEILSRVEEHRCITPRHLVPTGHTETWRVAGGPTPIRRPLQVSVVRFAGLRAYENLTTMIRAAHPNMAVTDHVIAGADDAAAAIAAPADVVVLTARGYTRAGWGRRTRRPWPGGRWYAGGRGLRAAGTSLQDLVGALEQRGGTAAALVVLDVDHAAVLQSHLEGLLRSTSRLVFRTGSSDRRGELDELVALIGRADQHREQPVLVTAGLRHYRA